jgi:nicotinamidase-related amidase
VDDASRVRPRCATAVLVIDDYYGALGLPRAPIFDIVDDWPTACVEDGWAAIDRTVPLLQTAQANEIPIVYFTKATRSVLYARGTMVGSGIPESKRREIVAEIAPVDGDLVIEKVGPSGFYGTSIDFHLRSWRCDTLLICGESTSGCVRATVVDAFERGLSIGVVTDCCFDGIEASHWMSLFDIRQKYADLLDSADTAKFIESLDPPTRASASANGPSVQRRRPVAFARSVVAMFGSSSLRR